MQVRVATCQCLWLKFQYSQISGIHIYIVIFLKGRGAYLWKSIVLRHINTPMCLWYVVTVNIHRIRASSIQRFVQSSSILQHLDQGEKVHSRIGIFTTTKDLPAGYPEWPLYAIVKKAIFINRLMYEDDCSVSGTALFTKTVGNIILFYFWYTWLHSSLPLWSPVLVIYGDVLF